MKALNPEDRYLYTNGLRLHYLDWGNDEQQPMLLLHGFLGHAHVWDDFALNFRAHYHMIALDQRGHGESQWSKQAAYSIDDHFSDIAHFIETLDLNDLIVVGHSMGGRNALFYAACSPQKVERLVLVDSRPDDNPQASQALRHLLVSFPLQAGSLNEVAHAIQSLYPYLSRKFCRHIASHGYRQVQDGAFVPKYDIAMRLQSEGAGYATENLWLFMKHVTCPTLIVRGKRSPFLSRQDARKMCKLIPKAELREIPESTHMPAQENPTAFNKIISHFLNH
jgi:pimeloyl-ACP methyl ester carboxylesterase